MLRPKRKVTLRGTSNIKEESPSDSDNETDTEEEFIPKKVRKTKQSEKQVKSKRQLHCTDSIDQTVHIPKKVRKINQNVERKKQQDSTDLNKVPTQARDDPVIEISQPSNGLSTWNESDLLYESYNIPKNTIDNIVQLFQDDNTIPFMCRYRKDLIGNLSPDKLRDLKVSYNDLLSVKVKQEKVIKMLEKVNVLNNDLRQHVLAARSVDELDHLSAPFKSASKISLAERAKGQGLQEPAEQILFGKTVIQLQKFVNSKCELANVTDVREGIKHIIVSIVKKDTDLLEEIKRLVKVHRICIHSAVSKGSKKEPINENDLNVSKYRNYFDFHSTIDTIKPHQILAINRGESLKILKITVELSDTIKQALYSFLQKKYYRNKILSFPERDDLLKESFNEAICKKIQPLMIRQIRRELTKTAEKVSVDVFATNLKQLLLISPVKGKRILGIDPGFTNGCKIALISEYMDVLVTDVIYPHTKSKNKMEYGHILADMMNKYSCTLIALGNGTACRETEKWLSTLLSEGILDSKRIQYSIVNEQGASIYSCSDIAKKEFPDTDINLISAARRLSDPLGELVKVEPKHLGVGMYQHDINERYLNESLNEVVMECVSFVGVDINTASVTLLQHIAGLTPARAENICKYRSEYGPFKSREELKKVRLIGSKTFVQCAGFVRITPLSEKLDEYNLLDSTWVHPESYDMAENIIKKCGLSKRDIGSSLFIAKIKNFMLCNTLEQLANEFNRPKERIQIVLEALERELLRDYRDDFVKKPLFKQGLTKITDLIVNTIVTGGITNVTHFGCFVDIGVEKDALIHSSKLDGMQPNIGDRIEAIILNVDVTRGRISLKLINIF